MRILRRHHPDRPSWAALLAETVHEKQEAKRLAARTERAADLAMRRARKNHLTEAIVDFVTKGHA